jgi:FtsP/CotA-like multicopper oxidase with cupredoxin domain
MPDTRLIVGHTTLTPDGRKEVNGTTVNGVYPGPEIRVKEGQRLRIHLENYPRDQYTLIHWHGLLVAIVMEGVPYVAADPIHTQEVFVYEFPIRQTGTYWYHSHFALQKQLGVAGPFIIEPKDEPFQYDHEFIVFLTDWTYSNPYQIIPWARPSPSSVTRSGWRRATRPWARWRRPLTSCSLPSRATSRCWRRPGSSPGTRTPSAASATCKPGASRKGPLGSSATAASGRAGSTTAAGGGD